MMIPLVNLTQHAIVLRRADGSEITITPSGRVARVTTDETPTGEDIDGIPVVTRTLGAVQMPEITVGEIGIVSSMVLDHLGSTRHPMACRCVAPDTGKTAVRDGKGQVIAVTRLISLPD